MLAASMRIMAASSVSLQPFRNPIRSSSVLSSLTKKSTTGETSTNNCTSNTAATTNSSSNGRQKVAPIPTEPVTTADDSCNDPPQQYVSMNESETVDVITSQDFHQQHSNKSKSEVTTVLLQPENCCRVRTTNHVTYSIDTKPPHLVRGSPL